MGDNNSMKEINIQEMFKEKNREIIKNNLKLDIERNNDALINTLTIIFNNNFDIAIKNIISMFEDSLYLDSNKSVINNMNKLKLESYNLLNKKISEKIDQLNSMIDVLKFDEDINNYYALVADTSKIVFEIFKSDELYNLKKGIINDFNEFCNNNLNEVSANMTKSRISDYINYRLFGKIEDKVNEEIKTRDNNLLNKGKESYDKFKEISNMTTNI